MIFSFRIRRSIRKHGVRETERRLRERGMSQSQAKVAISKAKRSWQAQNV